MEDGTTAVIRTPQRSGDFHGPPITYGEFRCRGACPTRRGSASFTIVSVGVPYLAFNGRKGKVSGPTCEMRVTASFFDVASHCSREDRTLHCGAGGIDGPISATIVTTPRRCRTLVVGR